MRKLFKKEDFINAYYGKKVLVIGNTGFKGSWLSMWLNILGAKVFGYALKPISEKAHFNLLQLEKSTNCHFADIRNAEELSTYINRIKPDYVFHLAAQAIVRTSYNEPKLTFDTNIGGSVNVLEAVLQCNSVKSLVYVTSDKCYKNKEWIWGYRENDELGGVDPYSASKACAELVFESYKQCFFKARMDMGISSVRAGNVIGGGDWADNRIVPDCARAIMSGKDIEIRNPDATRPWQHVLEPLSGYLTLAARQYNFSEFSSSWNFGPDSNSIHTVGELTQRIIDFWGKGNLNIVKNNQFHESVLLKLDCDRALQKLSWTSRWNFDATVKRTVDWYQSYENGEIITQEQIECYMEEV